MSAILSTRSLKLSEVLSLQPSADDLCENPELCTKLESVADAFARRSKKQGTNGQAGSVDGSPHSTQSNPRENGVYDPLFSDQDHRVLDTESSDESYESGVTDGAVLGAAIGFSVYKEYDAAAESDILSASTTVHSNQEKTKTASCSDVESGNKREGKKRSAVAENEVRSKQPTLDKEKSTCSDDKKARERADTVSLGQLKYRCAFVVVGFVAVILIGLVISVVVMRKAKWAVSAPIPSSHAPSSMPSSAPSSLPSLAPSSPPTSTPSSAPSLAPSSAAPSSAAPSLAQSSAPSSPPTSNSTFNNIFGP